MTRASSRGSGGWDPRLEAWIDALLFTPGLTAVEDREEAWRLHVEDALTGAPLVESGPVADVGSGGGSPGIPLAVARPDLRVDLVEPASRKCDFLRSITSGLPNVTVVRARAEELAAVSGRDAYGTVLARALASPPVALEWCLPLAAPGGRVVLYTGKPELARLDTVASRIGGSSPRAVPVEGAGDRWLVVTEKLEPTPSRFPRKPGIARKRPLA